MATEGVKNNPVAKHMEKFNKPVAMPDKTKYNRRRKHKREQEKDHE